MLEVESEAKVARDRATAQADHFRRTQAAAVDKHTRQLAEVRLSHGSVRITEP